MIQKKAWDGLDERPVERLCSLLDCLQMLQRMRWQSWMQVTTEDLTPDDDPVILPIVTNNEEPVADNEYEDLDDEYDAPPQKKGGQVNNRMGTLNRQAGIINRNRNNGLTS